MILNRNPGRRELAVFGVSLPLAAALLGFVIDRRFGSTGGAQVVWAVGAVASLVYLAVPRWRRAIFVGWMYLTYPLSWLLSHVTLLIVYFLAIAPFGLVLRLIGRDPLALRRGRGAQSYWAEREPTREVDRYFRQS